MSLKYRMIKQKTYFILSYVSVILTLFILGSVIYFTFINGIKSWNLDFFLRAAGSPLNPHQGIAHAIQGSLILSFTASIIATPVSILAAIYLTEYASYEFRRKTDVLLNTMASIPSIVVGIVSYILLVLPLHSFSALSGSLALAFMMLPIMTKASEDAFLSVPVEYREAGLALGLHKWKVSIWVVLKIAKSGVLTAFALAFGRIFGETAPLLMTALGSRNYFTGYLNPISSITLLVYEYAKSPFQIWINIAWGASLLLLILSLGINLMVRIAWRK